MKNIRKRTVQRKNKPSSFMHEQDVQLNKITARDDAELDFLKKRSLISAIFIISFFAILVSRLWFLQIQQGDVYSSKADNNRVRYVEVLPPRGNIFDSKGREIVTNRPAFDVLLSREERKVDDALLKKLASYLEVEVTDILDRIRAMADSPKHVPVRVAEDIDWEKVALIENNRLELPGVRIDVVPVRRYHYDNYASHIIGYLGEISEKELRQEDYSHYKGGDLVGKMGLEKIRETQLHGEKGREYMEVNAQGFEQKYLKGVEPLPGLDIKLTIDIELQKKAEEVMAAGKKAGAVVAVDVNSGRVLVAASAPQLKIDEFVGGISTKAWQAMLNDERHPLINKVVQGQYPPASTYKVITALAGLGERVIDPETIIHCPGHYRLGRRTFRCWKRGGHGDVDLQRALAESCDVYFYQVGQQVGVDRLAEYAAHLGLGRKTGVNLEHEKKGLVPTASWKKRRYQTPWQEGETLTISIGQGFNLATPMQISMMTSALANGGTLYKPGIIESVSDPDGRLIEQFEPKVVDRLVGQGYNLKLIRSGLVEAVNGEKGTGSMARLAGINVAGKTGTAQVVRLKEFEHLQEDQIPYKYRDHAWFTCFAPAENPEIAVTVLVEHGLHGGSGAAPIARIVLEEYFKDRLKQKKDMAMVVVPGQLFLEPDVFRENNSAIN